MRSFNGLDNSDTTTKKKDKEELGVWYDVLSRYDSLLGSAAATDNDHGGRSNTNSGTNNGNNNKSKNTLEQMAIELWKYCLLYNGDGHIYLDYESSLLSPLEEMLTNNLDSNVGIVADHGVSSSSSGSGSEAKKDNYLHTGFLAISPHEPATYELGAMIRLLLETSDEMLSQNPLLLSHELHRMIVKRADSQTLNSNQEERNVDEKEEEENSATWTLWRNRCRETDIVDGRMEDGDYLLAGTSGNTNPFALSAGGTSSAETYARRETSTCPLSSGGYCCLAFSEEMPLLALRHPVGGWGGSSSSIELPYLLNAKRTKEIELKLGGVPEGDLPYISTVRMVRNDTEVQDEFSDDTPNFFDILFENDCLPYRKECHRCLKDVANEAPMTDEEGNSIAVTTTNACSVCQLECPCYCDILCKVRPPPKKVVRSYVVHPPRYKKEVGRLVPKIIHQVGAKDAALLV